LFFKKKSYIVPNGFPKFRGFRNIKKEYDFIYVGRIDKRKCVDLIIKASKILKNKNFEFSILIVGDGIWKKDIEKLIKKYNMKNNIKLVGYVFHNRVLEFISKSKFLILPSSYESDPLVIKESLSLGVPVISSDISAHIEKIKNEFNGFLFKNLDYKSLANVMEKALNLSNEKYEKMSKNAKESIINRSWNKVAKKYVKFFESLTNDYKNG